MTIETNDLFQFHFLLFPPVVAGRLKTANTAKKNVKQAPMMEKAQVDWHISRLQLYQHLFQVNPYQLCTSVKHDSSIQLLHYSIVEILQLFNYSAIQLLSY